ncbi:MAG: VCBS repeat-containing protein [Polyangiales bacterium]
MRPFFSPLFVGVCLALLGACGDSGGAKPHLGGMPVTPPAPSCNAASGGGSTTVQAPTLETTYGDRWHEGWLASPAVVDLDADGTNEIVIARAEKLLVFHPDTSIAWSATVSGRIWASPVVADVVPSHAGLEVAVAARGVIHLYDAHGAEMPGFPVTWRDELRSIATGDVDGDGQLELVVVTTSPLNANGQRDIVHAVNGNGSVVPGFPPNTTGAAGCDSACYVTGGYDQNLALGDVDGDSISDIFATQDNAYESLHRGDGSAFDAASIFQGRTKFQGVRFLLDYAEAQQGYSDTESTSNQAHFTNSAPAIVDVDGSGSRELVVLSSVQNAAQTDRYRGVALWVVNHDGTRPTDWIDPFHAPDYLAGLWDYDGTNVVAATNQVQVANLFPDRAGPEFVFAGFDGRIHCVDARASEIWTYQYTTSARVLTGGVAIADLSGDGTPEIVFSSYSPDANKSHLFVIDAGGNELHKIPLPTRGSMAVPTVADVNLDGDLEIVVPLKDAVDHGPMVQVYTVPGSSTNCMPWPTGRGNLRRDGYVP